MLNQQQAVQHQDRIQIRWLFAALCGGLSAFLYLLLNMKEFSEPEKVAKAASTTAAVGLLGGVIGYSMARCMFPPPRPPAAIGLIEHLVNQPRQV